MGYLLFADTERVALYVLAATMVAPGVIYGVPWAVGRIRCALKKKGGKACA